MKISLRKASALQNSINDLVKGLDFEVQVKINEFQVSEQEISRVATALCKNLERRENLLTALYQVRKAVSKANSEAGIDSKLADVALLEKQIQFYTGLAGNKVRDSHAVVEGRLEKIRNDKSESRRTLYGYNDTVDTTVLNQEDLDGFRQRAAEAKKAKQKLQDEILELNVQTQITVDEQNVKALQAEGLI